MTSTLGAHVREDAAADAAHTGIPLVRRDAHAKMHGCVQAELTVADDVPARFKHGIFARAGVFRAWVRFSNAHGLQHDLEIDPRGMAFKVLGVQAGADERLSAGVSAQDFLMVTHHSFFVPSPVAFVDFPMALRSGPSGLARFFFKRRLWRGAWALMMSGLAVRDNPLTMTYYSQTPYRLGPWVVKLQARPSVDPGVGSWLRFWLRALPCNLVMTAGAALGFTNATRAWCARRWHADSLRRALARTLAEGPVCFDIGVQQRTSDAMPVDDPTVPWSQEESPYRTVATLRIWKQPVAVDGTAEGALRSAAAAEMQALGEQMSFSPWHGLQAHEPLGSINRARRRVYPAIAALRSEANRVRVVEPSTDDFDRIRSMTEPPAAIELRGTAAGV
jgi:hypothetical protein